MRVGYVIAAYGDLDLARAARASIYRQVLDAPVVVVDDLTGDGYAATLNLGIRRLPDDVEIICCLNSDVEMIEHDGAIRELFEHDEEVAIVGPRQITREGPGEPYLVAHGGLVPEMDGGTEWDLDLRHRYWLAPVLRPDVRIGTGGTFEVPTVPGSVFYIHRTILQNLGGWPTWTRFYYEDTYLTALARLYGWKVLYTGETTWIHYGQQGSPLDEEARIDRMRIARERFCFECGRVGIPLRFDEALR